MSIESAQDLNLKPSVTAVVPPVAPRARGIWRFFYAGITAPRELLVLTAAA